PGTAYVYLVYGMHDCLNIVTEPAGTPAALLVRAVEPIDGIDAMRAAAAGRAAARTRRRPGSGLSRMTPAARLGSGPGLVCAILDIDRTFTGRDLLDPAGELRIEPRAAGEPAPDVVASPRVGIGYAGEPWRSAPWRLSIAGNPSVSRPVPVARDDRDQDRDVTRDAVRPEQRGTASPD
ncbi:MAG TPA: DNA-3-methyladenine glycosylase, partial [Candidatus Limnocylindrales bacterium]|nr:DNA-3-methyladenine glycosylase [Candidatus Limnocylindrales bacterium]